MIITSAANAKKTVNLDLFTISIVQRVFLSFVYDDNFKIKAVYMLKKGKLAFNNALNNAEAMFTQRRYINNTDF